MATIKCSGEGCEAVYETLEPFAPETKYSCRVHTPRRENKVQFQKHQFDKDLRRAAKPVGTSHITNQGSDILDSEDITTEKL